MKTVLRQPQWLSVLCVTALIAACNGGRPQPDNRAGQTPDGMPAPVGEWLAGDLHVHTDHSSDGSFGRQGFGSYGNTGMNDQLGQAQRMGLDWLPITDHRTHDQHYSPRWRSGSILLIEGEEANGGPHCTVHGAFDTIVQGADFPDTPRLRVLQQSVWDARMQNAVWAVAHPDDGHMNDDGSANDNGSALGLHLVEAWNRADNPDLEIDYLESRWNRGYRLGMAGASDNHFKELWAISGPGSPTTWVFAPNRTRRGILEGLRAGRTTLSAGPLEPFVVMEVDADGDAVFEALPGDALQVASGQTVRVRVTLERALGTTALIYAQPGRAAGALQEIAVNGLTQVEEFDYTVPEGPSWLRVEVRGPGLIAGLGSATTPLEAGQLPNLLDQLRAVASPVFFSTLPRRDPEPEVALPVDAGLDDGAEWALGAQGRFTGFADVAVANGQTHVVAESHAAGLTRILYRGPSAEQVLSESGFGRHPRVAVQGQRVWVVWQDSQGQELPFTPQIVLRRSDDGGASFAPAQQLSDGLNRAERPDIAVTPQGQAVVAWQDMSPQGVFDILAQVVGIDAVPANLSGDGKNISQGNPIDTRSPRWPTSLQPAVAVAGSGLIAVGWQDNRQDPNPLFTGTSPLLQEDLTPVSDPETSPDDWEVMVALRQPGAVSWAAPINYSNNADMADENVALDFAADGSLVTAWDQRPVLNQAGRDLELAYAVAADPAQAPAVQGLAENPPGMAQRPAIGRDAAGRSWIVWMDSRSDDWRWRIFGARLEAEELGPAQRLSGAGNAGFARLEQGELVFTTDRSAQFLQRDPTHQIWRRSLR